MPLNPSEKSTGHIPGIYRTQTSLSLANLDPRPRPTPPQASTLPTSSTSSCCRQTDSSGSTRTISYLHDDNTDNEQRKKQPQEPVTIAGWSKKKSHLIFAASSVRVVVVVVASPMHHRERHSSQRAVLVAVRRHAPSPSCFDAGHAAQNRRSHALRPASSLFAEAGSSGRLHNRPIRPGIRWVGRPPNAVASSSCSSSQILCRSSCPSSPLSDVDLHSQTPPTYHAVYTSDPGRKPGIAKKREGAGGGGARDSAGLLFRYFYLDSRRIARSGSGPASTTTTRTTARFLRTAYYKQSTGSSPYHIKQFFFRAFFFLCTRFSSKHALLVASLCLWEPLLSLVPAAQSSLLLTAVEIQPNLASMLPHAPSRRRRPR